MLKKSSASGSETFERLYLPHLARKSCLNLGIKPYFGLDVAFGALFSTGRGVIGTGEVGAEHALSANVSMCGTLLMWITHSIAPD